MKRPRRVLGSGAAWCAFAAAAAAAAVVVATSYRWATTTRASARPPQPQWSAVTRSLAHFSASASAAAARGDGDGLQRPRPSDGDGAAAQPDTRTAVTWTTPHTSVATVDEMYPLVDEPQTTAFTSTLNFSAVPRPIKDLTAFFAEDVVRPWWRANPPVPGNVLPDGRRVLTVAFCVYKQTVDKYYPEPQNEWLAWWLTRNAAFADRAVRYAPCVPTERQLPPGTDPGSEDGLRLLGLLDVDLRFCQFGSSSVVRLLDRVGPGDLMPVATGPRLAAAGLAPDAQGFTHGKRLWWPTHVRYLVEPASGRVVLPMLIRECIEPWRQESDGVNLQFEVKRDVTKLARATVSMFQPHLVNSVGRRLAPGPEQANVSVWTRKAQGAGPYPRSVAELVVRPVGFDAAAERRGKPHFAVFLNSHCSARTASTIGVVVRELFATELASTYKPVHALGPCPTNATPLRVAFEERARLANAYNELGGFGAYAKFKFTVAFENSGSPSYMSEKLLLAWSARSVPIYFGPGRDALRESVNERAFVYCDLPEAWTDENALDRLRRRVCNAPGVEESSPACLSALTRAIETALKPALAACVDTVRALDADDRAYEAMLAEPLVPGRRLVGVFNRTLSGELIRAVYDAMGFASGVSARPSRGGGAPQ